MAIETQERREEERRDEGDEDVHYFFLRDLRSFSFARRKPSSKR